jgi:hypothetical protein
MPMEEEVHETRAAGPLYHVREWSGLT